VRPPSIDVTVLLERWGSGDADALGELLPFLYGELRRLARSHMRRQAPGHTLQATALVHEVYLKLAEQSGLRFENRHVFLGLAAKAMRRLLVDHARERQAGKRGGQDALRVTLVEGLLGDGGKPDDVALLDDCLEALARIDPRKSRIVELKYFGGLKGEEIASLLGIGSATVTRELRLAEAWLRREMTEPGGAGGAAP
jgi:RNA polymerase sigma factor (TIGR02999 family)